MTSYREPDYSCTVAMEPADFEALSGKQLEIRIRLDNRAKAFRGMMILSQSEIEDDGIYAAWLWLNATAARISEQTNCSVEILAAIDWHNLELNPGKVTQGVGKAYTATITKRY